MDPVLWMLFKIVGPWLVGFGVVWVVFVWLLHRAEDAGRLDSKTPDRRWQGVNKSRSLGDQE